MIQWNKSAEVTPEPEREVILKNTKKIIFDKATGTRCKVQIFSVEDSPQDIFDGLDLHGFDLWAYTDCESTIGHGVKLPYGDPKPIGFLSTPSPDQEITWYGDGVEL